MRSPRRHRPFPVALALALLMSAASNADLLRVLYPDIEQGSSTLVVAPGGTALLIDAGSGLNPTDDSIADVVLDLFEAGIVTSLPYVIATHYDEDHIGRLEEVLQFGGVEPTTVVYDRGLEATPTTFAYNDYAFSAGQLDRQTITPLTVIDLGSGVLVRAYTVNAELPDMTSVSLEGTSQQENARSISVVVSYGDFDLWIGGDLTGNTDFDFANVEGPASTFTGDVDVYTLNHHGSTSSSTQTFLTNLKAEVGINQNSASNNFGHPNATIVQRFLATPDTDGQVPAFYQQNPGKPGDARSDDSLATGIADPDDVDGTTGLPGPITLLSDGTSYQIFAPGIDPIVRSADTGAGTLGDYPPTIQIQTSRTPLVPTSAESAVISARIEDEGTVTASIVWSLNGVPQAPIPMTSARGGAVFSGSIPAQADGALVRGRIRAVDSQPEQALSRTFCYFSGTTPISTVRDQDADGFLSNRGCAARVQGNLTAEPPLFHDFVAQMWVQDGTGGIQVFDGMQEALVRGDEVAFVGELGQFGGQTQVDISDSFGNYGHTFVQAGSAPAPQIVTVDQVDESLEGQLIRINGLTVVDGEIPLADSANLTVSDDGGISTLTLRVDGDTDIPAANTPLGTFDLIGLAAQFDSFFPWLSGYQILPRERVDFLSDEVNHPQVLLHEIHADPHDTGGDANGDGSVSATEDQFVEIVNTGYTPIDVSGWTLSVDGMVRHVFPVASFLPARELAVVFSGGTLVGDFGNTTLNGLAQLASAGSLDLVPEGGTITLSDTSRAVVQSVTYGSEANSNQSITRSPDATNTPFAFHTLAGTGRYSPGRLSDQTVPTIPPGAVLLSEVFYDASGSDDGFEWIELVNTTNDPIDLSRLAIGAGGSDYTSVLVELSGTLPPTGVFVLGGPLSEPGNGSPVYDLEIDIEPDLQNSGTAADGVALFNIPAPLISETAVPIDAVVYGPTNSNGLIDETGVANVPEVGDAPAGSSIRRSDLFGNWEISSPTPGSIPFGVPMFADGFESGDVSAW